LVGGATGAFAAGVSLAGVGNGGWFASLCILENALGVASEPSNAINLSAH
jgi:hypothetical protein